jgi:ribonuclease HI
MHPERRGGPGSDSPFPCYFCGEGEDSTPHVYGLCEVVRAARARVGAQVGCSLGDTMDVTLLAFPVVDNPAVAQAIVCFNWAVWTERSQYLPTLGYTPSAAHVVGRICQRASRRIPADKHTGRRGGEQAVAAFARAPPVDASVGFSDGSAKPNPGPCGAGMVVRAMGSASYIERSVPMGHGDNNKGEMGGIKGILRWAIDSIEAGHIPKGSTLLIFSDSALCIGFLVAGWSFTSWQALGHETRALLRELRRHIKVTFYWIRGHAGIPGNEAADKKAGEASRAAATGIELDPGSHCAAPWSWVHPAVCPVAREEARGVAPQPPPPPPPPSPAPQPPSHPLMGTPVNTGAAWVGTTALELDYEKSPPERRVPPVKQTADASKGARGHSHRGRGAAAGRTGPKRVKPASARVATRHPFTPRIPSRGSSANPPTTTEPRPQPFPEARDTDD